MSSYRWFALSVRPRHDKVVFKTLTGKGYETFLPTYKKSHRYPGRVKETELPLFPGYVFCRFDPGMRLPIVTTPGVIQVVGSGRVPIAVEEREILALQAALKAALPSRPWPFLQAGQRVRITQGALAGVEGIVTRFRQCLSLIISITLLQRSVLLEVDRDDIIPAGLVSPGIDQCAA